MNELIRLRQENAELREKLRLAIDIVTEFLDKGRDSSPANKQRMDKKSRNDFENLNAVI